MWNYMLVFYNKSSNKPVLTESHFVCTAALVFEHCANLKYNCNVQPICNYMMRSSKEDVDTDAVPDLHMRDVRLQYS